MGFSAGCRVSSLTIRNTLGSGCARASASVHPVNFSAAPFRKVTRLSTSVVITASPMLDRVTSYHWRCSCSSRVLRSKASLAARRSRSTCWRVVIENGTSFACSYGRARYRGRQPHVRLRHLAPDQDVRRVLAAGPCLEHGRRACLLHAVLDRARAHHRHRRGGVLFWPRGGARRDRHAIARLA